MALRPPRPPVVRVLEHERVALPRRLDTPQIRECLMNTSARAGVQAFEFRGRSLYARDIVGVIALSSVVVEILPKVNDTSTADDATGFLVDLLQFTSPHTRLSISEAFLAIGKKSLLEVILAW